jgi:hypothetical protein
MNLFEIPLVDLIGVLIGFSFTFFIFSYIWGDNAIFRWTIHIFIGVAAGYTLVVTTYNVILPHLIFPLLSANRSEKILAVIYLIPSALVLTKISPRLSKLGNGAMAILVGIGAAAAVGGAVIGTVTPQMATTINLFETQNILDATVILVGTLSTLIYFQFGIKKKADNPTPQSQMVTWIGYLGQGFIAITFGALFAGVYYAALTALIERFSFLWHFVRDLLLPTIFAP